ncbi:MAG: hypothetical protein H0U57_10860 [Tatlockia sp.]|nr:hypothetical protein [Tatlockia sp.]
MINFIKHVESFVSRKLDITKDIFRLSMLEAKLAAMNLAPLLINLGTVIVVLLTIWLTIMVFIGELVYIFTELPLVAIGTVLVLNLLLIIFLARDIKNRIQEMTFSRTRDCLREKPAIGSEIESSKERAIRID